MERPSPFSPTYFLLIFAACSLASIATLLWRHERVRPLRWVMASATAGLLGTAAYVILYWKLGVTEPWSSGVSALLMGVGGQTLIDLAFGSVARTMGFDVDAILEREDEK